MPLPIVAVRSHHHEPDALFPSVTEFAGEVAVVLHADDGDTITVAARDLSVRSQRQGHLRDELTVRRKGLELVVTESRVIVKAEYVAGQSMLAGHVKYPWLVAVGGSPARGRFDRDELRIVVQRSEGDYDVLTLGFDGPVDVHGLAREIAQRAAQCWLATHPGATGEHLAAWTAVARAPLARGVRGEFALHQMPEYVQVGGAQVGLTTPFSARVADPRSA